MFVKKSSMLKAKSKTLELFHTIISLSIQLFYTNYMQYNNYFDVPAVVAFAKISSPFLALK